MLVQRGIVHKNKNYDACMGKLQGGVTASATMYLAQGQSWKHRHILSD